MVRSAAGQVDFGPARVTRYCPAEGVLRAHHDGRAPVTGEGSTELVPGPVLRRALGQDRRRFTARAPWGPLPTSYVTFSPSLRSDHQFCRSSEGRRHRPLRGLRRRGGTSGGFSTRECFHALEKFSRPRAPPVSRLRRSTPVRSWPSCSFRLIVVEISARVLGLAVLISLAEVPVGGSF